MRSRLSLFGMFVVAALVPYGPVFGDDMVDSAQSGPTLSEAAPATLYIFNVSGPTLFASNQEITDNGNLIASLPRMTYKQTSISPGEHEFRFKAFPQGKRVAKLTAEAGKTYYLLVGYSPARSWAFPLAGDSMVIKLVGEDEANLAKQETKKVE